MEPYHCFSAVLSIGCSAVMLTDTAAVLCRCAAMLCRAAHLCCAPPRSCRLQTGQKAIFHLEAFVARFMSLYKTWCISNFASE